MFLALTEMRRAKTRFGLLVSAIALLVFLILFQQSLQNGLITGFIGAIENQNAPVIVYSVDGQRVVQGSIITPDLEAELRTVEEIGEIGRLGQGTFTGQTSRSDDTFDTTIIGYELGPDGDGLGAPAELAAGRYPAGPLEGVASTGGDFAFEVGDTVVLQPGGFAVEVVGLADDIQLNVAPTVFTSYDTWSDAVRSVNPDADDPLPNVMVASPADGVTDDQLVEAINDQALDFDALTRADAAAKTPGVSQVQQSFQLIFLLYGLVVPCVTGLFFLIVTFQKANALTLLRAIGAPASRLVSSLLIQVAIIIGGGLAVGTALYYPISQARVGGLSLRFETGAVIFWAVLLLVLGVISSLFAARRLSLAADSRSATTPRLVFPRMTNIAPSYGWTRQRWPA